MLNSQRQVCHSFNICVSLRPQQPCLRMNLCVREAYVVLGFRLDANATSAMMLTSAHLVTPLTALSAIMQF